MDKKVSETHVVLRDFLQKKRKERLQSADSRSIMRPIKKWK